MTNKKIELFSLIAGIIFILSGVSKSMDAAAFSNIITEYGFANFSFISPIIILAEITIGLGLIFQILQKTFAGISTVIILFFTLIYLYGSIFLNIQDCGCFGKFTFLNTSPFIVLTRNTLLLYLLIIVWIKGKDELSASKWTYLTIFSFICLISFVTGYTYNTTHSKNSSRKKQRPH